MAITYAAIPVIRPAGQTQSKPPLILRNPQNDNTKYDYIKCGPFAVIQVGLADYRMIYEGLTDQQGSLTNFLLEGRATAPWVWTRYTNGNPPHTSPLAGGSWEAGEICVTDIYADYAAGLYRLFYHRGHHAGPRQLGFFTSPMPSVLASRSFTRHGSNAVVTNGTSGQFDDKHVADCTIVEPTNPANPLIMLYRGVKVSDGKSRIGRATSTDQGVTWTKSGMVLDLGSGNDAQGCQAPWAYMDELGRIHMWYIGTDGSAVERVLYAYSDNDGVTWTRNASQIILDNPPSGAGSSDPDLVIGDTVNGWIAEGIVYIGNQAFNFSGYTGDAIGRLDGRGMYWLPCEAATTPARPARAFTLATANSRVTVNAAATLANSSQFTIWTDFKCPPHNTFREIYTEL